MKTERCYLGNHWVKSLGVVVEWLRWLWKMMLSLTK